MKKCKRIFVCIAILSCSTILFSQNIKITSEPSGKGLPIEEGDKVLASGGAFGAAIFDNLTSNGILKLNGTTVKNTLHVDGSLLTQGASLNAVEVCGEANFKNTIIAQAIQVIGSLRAEKCTFKGHLSLTSIRATFLGSQIGSIHVSKESNCKGHQIIELKQKTSVDGPIVFESGKGEVHSYPGSYVSGPITGGKLIKKN
jgi:hypothetical protein